MSNDHARLLQEAINNHDKVIDGLEKGERQIPVMSNGAEVIWEAGCPEEYVADYTQQLKDNLVLLQAELALATASTGVQATATL